MIIVSGYSAFERYNINCLLKKYDCVTAIVRSQQWLPVKKQIIMKTLLLTCKVLNSLALPYLCDLLDVSKHTRTLRPNSNKGISLVIP